MGLDAAAIRGDDTHHDSDRLLLLIHPFYEVRGFR